MSLKATTWLYNLFPSLNCSISVLLNYSMVAANWYPRALSFRGLWTLVTEDKSLTSWSLQLLASHPEYEERWWCLSSYPTSVWMATAACSHEIKRCLLFGRKTMANLDSILKNRDVTLPTKVHTVKAMVFPEVMYRCDSWTINKAEHRIDTYEFWCWTSPLPWLQGN